jgi:hypothetical protein
LETDAARHRATEERLHRLPEAVRKLSHAVLTQQPSGAPGEPIKRSNRLVSNGHRGEGLANVKSVR